jgi:hypothetical protein
MAFTIPLFDIGLISIAIAALFFVHEVAKTLKELVRNTTTGLVVLGISHVLGVSVVVTPLVMFEIAIGGIPGAIIVVVMSYLGITLIPH